MPHKHIFYVNGTDVSVLSAQEASGYFYQNPVDGSSDFYTNTASSMDFNDNTYTNYFQLVILIVASLIIKDLQQLI